MELSSVRIIGVIILQKRPLTRKGLAHSKAIHHPEQSKYLKKFPWEGRGHQREREIGGFDKRRNRRSCVTRNRDPRRRHAVPGTRIPQEKHAIHTIGIISVRGKDHCDSESYRLSYIFQSSLELVPAYLEPSCFLNL